METAQLTSPFQVGFNPLLREASWFTFNVPKDKQLTKSQTAIISSGKKIEELTQAELREVYFFISAQPGKRLYSASAVNYMDRKNRYPDEFDIEESDSLFIGDQVHKAMEVKGANLQYLHSFEALGEVPKKPVIEGVTGDHFDMMQLMAKGDHFSVAYMKTKANQSTKATCIEDVMTVVNGTTESLSEERIKAATKVVTSSSKEHDKFKDSFERVKLYFTRLEQIESSKARVRALGGIVVDDLPYRKMPASRVIDVIKRSYDALSCNQEIMTLYHSLYPGQVPYQIESHSEHVVLWKYKTDKFEVPCKSMFDRFHIDWTNKQVYILDIKTHSKSANQFVETNYIDYAYYRSMAFYTEAVIQLLIQRGVPEQEARLWNIVSLLLPVSTFTFEVGCYYPYVVISQADINMGTYGSFVKPFGTKFNADGHAQYSLSPQYFDKLKDLGVMHDKAFEYYTRGWKRIIENYEQSMLFHPPTIGT